MTTLVALAPDPILQFFDNEGNELAGGQLTTLVAGAAYPTYIDPLGAFAFPNPITLNPRGEVATASGTSNPLYLAQGVNYTFYLQDSQGNTIWTIPNITAPATISQVLAALTPQALGAILWPASPNETASNIVPTNFVLQLQIDLERYGGGTAATATANNLAMANAIAVIGNAGGGTLRLLGAGTYTFSNPATFVLPTGMTIQGSGAQTVMQYTGTGVFLTCNSTGGRQQIFDISIYGPTGALGMSMPAAGLFGLVLGDINGNASRLTMRRVIMNGWDRPLRIGGATWCNFEECEFGSALGGNSTTDVLIANNVGVDFNFFGSNNYSSQLMFRDCTIANNANYGVYPTNTSITMNGVSFINCTMQSNCVANAVNGIQFYMGLCNGFKIETLYIEYQLGGIAPEAVRTSGLGMGSISDFFINGCSYAFHDAGGGSVNSVDIERGEIVSSGATPILMASEHDVVVRDTTVTGTVTLTGSGCRYLPLGSGLASWPTSDATLPTPTLSATSGTPTYTTNTGIYSQVGNIVFFTIQITTSALGSLSGSVQINGLPVAAQNNIALNTPCAMYATGITLSGSNTQFVGLINPGTTVIALYQIGGTAAQIQGSALATVTTIEISGSYQT